MQLKSGDEILIRNVNTGETGQMHISGLWERNGQYVVEGTMHTHTVHVVRGVVKVPPRRSTFVVLPHETAENVRVFTLLLKGLPLVVRKDAQELYIVNWARELRGGDPPPEFAAKVIDAYFHWQLRNALPEWLRERQRKEDRGDNGHGLWMPG